MKSYSKVTTSSSSYCACCYVENNQMELADDMMDKRQIIDWLLNEINMSLFGCLGNRYTSCSSSSVVFLKTKWVVAASTILGTIVLNCTSNHKCHQINQDWSVKDSSFPAAVHHMSSSQLRSGGFLVDSYRPIQGSTFRLFSLSSHKMISLLTICAGLIATIITISLNYYKRKRWPAFHMLHNSFIWIKPQHGHKHPFQTCRW